MKRWAAVFAADIETNMSWTGPGVIAAGSLSSAVKSHHGPECVGPYSPDSASLGSACPGRFGLTFMANTYLGDGFVLGDGTSE